MNKKMTEIQTIWRRIQITKNFRTFCAGRLFWRHRNPSWKIWDEADIACVVNRDRTREMFQTLEQLEVYIIDCLAYPDDKTTRDFEKPRRSIKKVMTLRDLHIAPDDLKIQPTCPTCKSKNSMYTVRVMFEDKEAADTEISYMRCSVCHPGESDPVIGYFWEQYTDLPPAF